MVWLSNKIINFMLKYKVISDDEEVIDFYRYGIEILISSLINILLVLILGLVSNGFYNALIYLFAFILIRQFSGGFHANTYFKCIFLTNLGFISVNLLSKLTYTVITPQIAVACLFPVTLIIVVPAPIENPNKPIPYERKKFFKTISLVLCIISATISILLINNKVELGTALLSTLLYISILSAVAVFIRKEVKK